MIPANLLEASHLSVHFQTETGLVKAVDDLSFHLKKGETLGIVGGSGSGKTLTSLALMGLLPKNARFASGEIFFQNKQGHAIEINASALQELRKIRGCEIAMIFQDPQSSLNPVFRCGDQVAEAILQHQTVDQKVAKAQTLEWFGRVKLDDPERIFRSYPHELSGGQRQRVMIAMALANRPSLLIADEPTSSLDVTVQRSVLDLLQELKKELGLSLIFISHDLSVVASLADRVLVMQAGRVVEEGSPREVFQQPKHDFTKQLVLAINGHPKQKKEDTKPKNIALTIKGLRTWFPAKRNFFGKTAAWTKAVDEVSLDIYEGETLGLVGESGSGKTTLGRTLLHLQQPTGGTILYDGKSLEAATTAIWKTIRREMQVIFQDPYSSLNPRKMIGPAIMEPMTVHGIGSSQRDRERMAMELLLRTGLEEEHFWRFPAALSGGQRQRACIARALSVRPRFLVCDECVSALDATVQSKIIALLKELQAENNLTYLFISHDLSVVRQITDRIAVMQQGRLVELDTADNIYGQPQHAYTKSLLEAVPVWSVG